VLARHRHVDVHRVPQWLGRVEVLHPERGPVAERVNAVVLGQRVVAQHGSPEVDVQVAWPGGYRDLDLLHGTTVGDGSLPTSDLGDRPR
jgi:hypothetical protein